MCVGGSGMLTQTLILLYHNVMLQHRQTTSQEYSTGFLVVKEVLFKQASGWDIYTCREVNCGSYRG